jgi:type I restriction enzyme, S subunit
MSKGNHLIPKLRFPAFRESDRWSEEALSGVATIVMGSSPKSECYNQSEIGLPLLQGNADIKNRLSAPRVFTSEITKECTVGDILLSVRAPVGNVAKSLHHACIGRGIAGIRADRGNSQEFVYQWLLSYESRWVDISQGGTFDAINSDDLKGVVFAVPRPPEQQKIAVCLNSVDELMAAQVLKVDALKTHKKGLMQQLFPREGETQPRLRFPEFENAGEWDSRQLRQLTSKISDGIHTTPIYDEAGEYAFINGNNLADGKILISEKTKRVNAAEFNRYDHPLDSSSILLSINGTIGNLAIFRGEKVVLGKSACFINIDSRLVNKLFIYYVLQTDSVKGFFNLELTGSTIKNLSLGTIKSAQLLVPTLPEQQRIADCLTTLDALITAETQKLDALKTHKKGLMQQLFPSPEEVAA